MKTTLERELKLDPPAGFELPELEGEKIEPRLFTSIYYDTPKRSLTRAGITLRRRDENGVTRWQLKLPRGGNTRSELEEHGHAAGPPDTLTELLSAHRLHGDLEPVATLHTRRHGVRVQDGLRTIAEVTFDEVEAVGDAGAFTELEVELVEGNEDDLEQLGRTLRRAGAKRSDGQPKLMRVLHLPDGNAPGRAPAVERVRGLLAAQLRELEAHDPGVRAGDDPEDVHRCRVATRRARAIVRATEPLLATSLSELADELKWLASLLGPVRDLDVLLERLRAEVVSLGDERAAGETVVATFERERSERRGELLAGLRSERYTALLASFAERVEGLAEHDDGGKLKPLAANAHRKLEQQASELEDEPPDESLHALRIRAKRARYAAELLESKKVERYLDAVKRLQDVAGEHQDAVVAIERLQRVATADNAVAVGRLVEREHERKRRCRRALPAALSATLRQGRKALG